MKTEDFLKAPMCEVSHELTSTDLANALEQSHLMFYEGKSEHGGQNRGAWVDEINKWIGVNVGSPYCLSGIIFNLRKLEPQFGIKFEIPNFASTQLFWLSIPKEHRTDKPGRFCIGIFRSKSDPTRGHAVYCKTGSVDQVFNTFEFNTDIKGSRDGGGAMSTKRNVAGTPTLDLLGFVDLSKCWKKI